MRLVNSSTLKLKDFIQDPPAYAILSHRWEDEEVSLQDIASGQAPARKGYAKIERFCEHAAADGWEWCWIDTCCIDKTSSAELSESINSMFKWYEQSQVCYAYLSDVTGSGIHGSRSDRIENSKWFTRGWTLQELLAPPTLIFLNQDWIDIGTKASLDYKLKEITGIFDIANYNDASVAQKMSWASARKTTRLEDEAYCLLGLFGVTMPLLYGEGSKAFMRLQLEILGQSSDESIFAWKGHNTAPGLLADSPRLFTNARDTVPLTYFADRGTWGSTNKGFRIQLQCTPPVHHRARADDLYAFLNCAQVMDDHVVGPLSIYLRQVGQPDVFTKFDSKMHQFGVPIAKEHFRVINYALPLEPLEEAQQHVGLIRSGKFKQAFHHKISDSPSSPKSPVLNGAMNGQDSRDRKASLSLLEHSFAGIDFSALETRYLYIPQGSDGISRVLGRSSAPDYIYFTLHISSAMALHGLKSQTVLKYFSLSGEWKELDLRSSTDLKMSLDVSVGELLEFDSKDLAAQIAAKILVQSEAMLCSTSIKEGKHSILSLEVDILTYATSTFALRFVRSDPSLPPIYLIFGAWAGRPFVNLTKDPPDSLSSLIRKSSDAFSDRISKYYSQPEQLETCVLSALARRSPLADRGDQRLAIVLSKEKTPHFDIKVEVEMADVLKWPSARNMVEDDRSI